MWSFLRQRVTSSLVRTQLPNDSSSITKHKKPLEDLAKTHTNQSLIQCQSTSEENGDGNRNNKKKKTCNGQQHFYPRYDCSLLETLGWVGTALALGSNFKLFHKVPIEKDRLRRKPFICQSVTDFLWGVVAAHPTKSVSKFALPKISDATSVNSPVDVCQTVSSESSSQPILDVTKKELEALSREYFGHLETIAGLEAIETDSVRGLLHFKEGSRLGNAKAHFNLGVCYETGQGTEIDMQKAAFHYGEASKANHPMATYNLGVFYLEGKENLAQNIEKGLELIEKAAALGLTEAKTYMGIYYFEKSNWTKAFPLLKEACVEDSEAQYYLSCCYKHGLGVQPDAILAEKYFNLSSASGFDQSIDWVPCQNEDNTSKIRQTSIINSDRFDLPIQSGLHTSISSPEISPNISRNGKNTYGLAISRYLDIILPQMRNSSKVRFVIGDNNGLDNLDEDRNCQLSLSDKFGTYDNVDNGNLEFLSLSEKFRKNSPLSNVNNTVFVR